MTEFALWLISLMLIVQAAVVKNPDDDAKAQAAAHLRALLDAAPKAILHGAELPIHAPSEGWELGMISWVDVDREGNIYLLQRGNKADPVVVIDREGRVFKKLGQGTVQNPA